MLLYIILTFIGSVVIVFGQSGSPEWRIPEQSLPSHDVPVIGYSVLELGAKGDGVTDDTHAFQKGIDALFNIGGGTLWVPAGNYALRGNLILKSNVVIRGEWTNPYQNNYKIKGTILMVYSGKGSESGKPFIEMHPVSAVQYLNIWYPEQGKGGVLSPYPTTIKNKNTNFINCKVTIENLTLVNSWKGINIGPQQNTLWTIRNVNGFPLKIGIETDDTLDIGRMHKINFAPEFWVQSGLNDSPTLGSTAIKKVYDEGTAILIRKHDFVSYAAFRIRGYNMGIAGDTLSPTAKVEERMKQFDNNFFQGHFYDLDIADCKIGIRVKALLGTGVFFSGSTISGDQCGIQIEETEFHPVGVTECTISGGEYSINNKGSSLLSVVGSKLTGCLNNVGGTLSLLDSSIVGQDDFDLKMGNQTKGARINNLPSANKTRITPSEEASKVVYVSELGKPIRRIDPKYRHTTAYDVTGLKPGAKNLIVYDGKSGPVTSDEEDHSKKAQEYLYELSKKGGGILFFPPGFYSFYHSIIIPMNVEIRGAIDTPIHAVRPGTTFNVLTPPGKPMDTAFITMFPNSGLKGICLNYPDQNYTNFKSYPFSIRGKGAQIYIQNVTASSVMHYLDLGSNQCDEHFVDYISGCALKTGIYVGGNSQGGRIYNSQLIGHYWWLYETAHPSLNERYWVSSKGLFPVPEWFEEKTPDKKGSQNILLDYQMESLNGFILGDVRDQIFFHNFSYGHLRGLYTINQGKGGADVKILLHGSDRSKYAADFSGLSPSRDMTLVAFMSFVSNKDEGVNIKLGKNAQSYVNFLDAELGGHHKRVFEIENGHLYVNGLRVSLLADGITIDENARLTLNGLTFGYKSKNVKPEELLLENTKLGNFYYKPEGRFIEEKKE
jgi:hypothetical protein